MPMGPEFTFAIHRFKVLRKKVADARNIGKVNPQDVQGRNDALAEAIALLMVREQEVTEMGGVYPPEMVESRKRFQQQLEKWTQRHDVN
jgi:threonine aldolase